MQGRIDYINERLEDIYGNPQMPLMIKEKAVTVLIALEEGRPYECIEYLYQNLQLIISSHVYEMLKKMGF